MVGTLTSSVAILLSGHFFAPRLGPRITVLTSFLAVAISTAALPYLDTIGALYASMALAGFGRGAAYPLLMGLAIARLPDTEKATAMGFFQAVYAIGMFAGPVVAGQIGGAWGYTELFLSTAVVSLFTALAALRLPRQS